MNLSKIRPDLSILDLLEIEPFDIGSIRNGPFVATPSYTKYNHCKSVSFDTSK